MRSADLVINATPVGMSRGSGSAVPVHWLREGQVVLDMVYGTARPTELVAGARAAGAVALDGLGMLVAQGCDRDRHLERRGGATCAARGDAPRSRAPARLPTRSDRGRLADERSSQQHAPGPAPGGIRPHHRRAARRGRRGRRRTAAAARPRRARVRERGCRGASHRRVHGACHSSTSAAYDIDPAAALLLKLDLMRRYDVLPIKVQDDELILAMADPANIFAIDDVRIVTGKQIRPVVVAAKRRHASQSRSSRRPRQTSTTWSATWSSSRPRVPAKRSEEETGEESVIARPDEPDSHRGDPQWRR